ncbi:hypothetical protein EJ04DRAFT_582111 [Polyplosphaeria fusca]|uniref:Ph domain-containing protein n=1 Tax=Polyplosphaeria fusca TaxID=682080 RepID=A0A9P4UVX6_9PLEO|nr:hypothetical protein EJ04DRAFT_582111 [Polyplosphaeria fusca]
MSNVVGKYAAKYAMKKVLRSDQNKYKEKKVESQYDPYYEMIPNPKNPSKMKKVKKQIPAYIPEHDANILAKARKSAYRLDLCLFNFLGFRFGWSSVIGIVPAVGDVLDMLLALMLIQRMTKVEGGLPSAVKMRMMFNLIIDFVVGLVPFVGDLADAALKCNSRNVRALEEHLDTRYKPKELVDEDDREYKRSGRRPRPATVYEDFSDEELERRHTFDDVSDDVRVPARTHSRRDRIEDEEMGLPRHHKSHRSKHEQPSRSGTKNSRR